MISYVSLKTKTHATVPLKPIVKELLTNLPKEEVSDPTFNNNIRNICREVGITEAVKVFKAGKEVEGENGNLFQATRHAGVLQPICIYAVPIYTQ